LLVPYQATFDPRSLSMTATIGVLPIALALFLPFIKGKPRGTLILLLWAVFSFIAWHVTFRTFRYLMPVMAVCCLWLGWALASSARETKRGATVLKAVVSLTLLINAGLFIGLSDYVNHSVDASLGARDPERYLSQSYELYPAIDYLNRLDPLPGKVLFVGEMRGFYSRFPREVPSHNAPNRLFEMVKRGLSPSSIAAQLHDAGFSFILFNPSEWERMAYVNRNAPLWRLNDRDKASFFTFLQDQTKTLFAANGVSVHLVSYEE
jgi:hypothetical protein